MPVFELIKIVAEEKQMYQCEFVRHEQLCHILLMCWAGEKYGGVLFVLFPGEIRLEECLELLDAGTIKFHLEARHDIGNFAEDDW